MANINIFNPGGLLRALILIDGNGAIKYIHYIRAIPFSYL
jgi:hypothetical protein